MNTEITSLIARVTRLEQRLLAYGRQKTGDFLLRAGGAMTGPLVLYADPESPLEAATKSYVDSHSGPRGGGGSVHNETPVGIIDGLNRTFTAASPPSPPESLVLVHNGLALRYRADYYVIGDQIQISMAQPPQRGDWLAAHYTL